MASRPDLADLLTRVVREINSHNDLGSTVAAAVASLHASLPEGHLVGLCLQQPSGTVETVAVSDEVVHDLEALQHELGEGTCPDALHGSDLAVADPLDGEARWAGYLRLAQRHAVDAQLSVRLVVDDRAWGALTVYSTGGQGISAETERLASLFAVHAAIALARSHREDNLKVALETRKLIGQAVGLTMERFELDEDLAFRYLVRLSSTGNVKLRDIATELVAEANLKANGGS